MDMIVDDVLFSFVCAFAEIGAEEAAAIWRAGEFDT